MHEWQRFLKTEESLLAYSESEIELVLLASMIGRQINVIGYDHRNVNVNRYFPSPFVPSLPEVSNDKGILWCINYTDYHWTLVVERPIGSSVFDG